MQGYVSHNPFFQKYFCSRNRKSTTRSATLIASSNFFPNCYFKTWVQQQCFNPLNWDLRLRSTKFIEDDENFNNLTDCLRLLKEWCFTNGVDPPAYECTNIFGLAHDKTYCMSCRVLELVTSGEQRSNLLFSFLCTSKRENKVLFSFQESHLSYGK